jgi:hypothetical protein
MGMGLSISMLWVNGKTTTIFVELEQYPIVCHLCGNLLHLLSDYQKHCSWKNASIHIIDINNKGKTNVGQRERKENQTIGKMHNKANLECNLKRRFYVKKSIKRA